jgi:hypothetical protein
VPSLSKHHPSSGAAPIGEEQPVDKLKANGGEKVSQARMTIRQYAVDFWSTLV